MFVLFVIKPAMAADAIADEPLISSWAMRVRHHLVQTWTEGANEAYVPMYAWHNRSMYDHSRALTYNENPWGGGLGKGFYDEDGDWHALYAMVFQDSHRNFEPAVGYAFLKTIARAQDFNFGGGFTVLVTARPDIFNNIPFPGILPWTGITYKRLSLMATYIPGGRNVGNVLFAILKWTL